MASRSRRRNRHQKSNAAGRELIASIREALHAARTGDMAGITIRQVEAPEDRGVNVTAPVTLSKKRTTLPS